MSIRSARVGSSAHLGAQGARRWCLLDKVREQTRLVPARASLVSRILLRARVLQRAGTGALLPSPVRGRAGRAGRCGVAGGRPRRDPRLLRGADPLDRPRLRLLGRLGPDPVVERPRLEIEANVAPDGFGPFDVISVFGRVEVRYDCVWTRACAIFDSANAYGYSRIGKLPKRLIGRAAHRLPGHELHRRHAPLLRHAVQRDRERADDRALPARGARAARCAFWQTPARLALLRRALLRPRRRSRTSPTTTRRVSRRRSACLLRAMLRAPLRPLGRAQAAAATQNGRGAGDTLLLDPNCDYDTIGAAADMPNPFRAGDFNPLIGTGGSRALPYRPGAELRRGLRRAAPARRARRLLPERPPRSSCSTTTSFDPVDDELPPRRARLEPRREPAGAEGAEGALRRPRDVRQPALAARRLPDDRLGQDRALPQPGPVQPAGRRRSPRSRRLEESRISLWAVRGDLVVLRRRAAQRRAPRARDELRPVRADRPRALRRAVRAARRLRSSPSA